MIYLCIPAHNEEQTVGVVLWKIRQVMAELQRDYQLLVADDASTDRSQDVLEPYTRVLPLTVLRNAERRGYAASLEMLLREAVSRSDYPKRDIIITLQADFTDEPGHVGTLVKRIESGADIVTSNMLPGPNAPRFARWRRPALNALVRRLGWPEDVRDPLNGFAAYRVFCIRRALEERKGERLLRHEGWSANAQLLHSAVPHARRIDAVDQQPHPERLQRTSRFQFIAALKQVLGLRRGRVSAGQLAVGELRPSSVLGGPSSQRSLVAESLRNGSTSMEEKSRPRSRNGAQRTRPERSTERGEGPRRSGRGGVKSPGAEGVPRGKEAKRSRPAAERSAASAERKPKSSGGARNRDAARKPRPARPASQAAGASTAAELAPGAEGVAPAGIDPTVGGTAERGEAGASARKRSRRGRRGGGRPRRDAESPPLAAAAPADEGASERADSAGEFRQREVDTASAGPPAGYEHAAAAFPAPVPEESPDAGTRYAQDGTASVTTDPSQGYQVPDAEGATASPRRRRSNRRGGRGRRRRTEDQPQNGTAVSEAPDVGEDRSAGANDSESTPQHRAS